MRGGFLDGSIMNLSLRQKSPLAEDSFLVFCQTYRCFSCLSISVLWQSNYEGCHCFWIEAGAMPVWQTQKGNVLEVKFDATSMKVKQHLLCHDLTRGELIDADIKDVLQFEQQLESNFLEMFNSIKNYVPICPKSANTVTLKLNKLSRSVRNEFLEHSASTAA